MTCRLRFVHLMIAMSLLAPAPAAASDEALLKLLQILRDRGSITADEYDEMRRAVEASVPNGNRPAPSSPPPPQPASPPPAAAPAVTAQKEGAQPPAAPRPEPKWFEKFNLRGYTQFRFTESAVSEGPPLDVPADRSVNQAESFVIRRGRLVLSGDVSERLALYVQLDVNASTGAPDFSVQLRDAYSDYWLNAGKTYRLRLGQSKVPYGFVNMQSSQNRLAIERPEGINLAAEGERDIGAFLMWESPEARRRFRDLVNSGLKGSGDYGVVAVGGYAGQGPNRSDQNGDPHVLARVTYPFKLHSGQFFELAVQTYYGRFVSPLQAFPLNGRDFTPERNPDGVIDRRVGVTAIWYPQPFGVEAEWNVGRGPQLSDDLLVVESRSLNGGYLQLAYRASGGFATWLPFMRWNYYDGGRKFARNAPPMRVNELDFGLEFAKWAELEATVMYTRTFARPRTSAYPYTVSKGGNRVGFQVQWNY